MAERRAACSCGQLTVTVEGDPVRVSMCHCRVSVWESRRHRWVAVPEGAEHHD